MHHGQIELCSSPPHVQRVSTLYKPLGQLARRWPFLVLAFIILLAPYQTVNAQILQAASTSQSRSTEAVTCYAVADGYTRNGVEYLDNQAQDSLAFLNIRTGATAPLNNRVANIQGWQTSTPIYNIEAIAFAPAGQVLYAANQNHLGTLDIHTGHFSPHSHTFGTGQGYQNGAYVIHTISDVDGMSYDIREDTLYGVERITNGPDLLFQIDTEKGTVVPNAFQVNGQAVDFVELPIISGLHDVDDIAIDPLTGIMYGLMNDGGAGGMLVLIDKSNGETVFIGYLMRQGSGELVEDMEGLSFSNHDGNLYASTGNAYLQNNLLWQVNTRTAIVNQIGAFTNNLVDIEALGCLSAPVALDVEKTTNGADADTPTGPYIESGSPVVWSYTVANTGSAEVTNIVVNDDQLPEQNPVCTIDRLAPGQTSQMVGVSCEAQGIATEGQYVNTATAIGDVDPTTQVQDSDPSHYFGFVPARVSGYVWFDSNSDGQQDTFELGVNNVTVTLFGAGPDGIFNTLDDLILTQDTVSNGHYTFDYLLPGEYTLWFEQPEEFIGFTAQDVGVDSSDSDVIEETGRTPIFTIDSQLTAQTWDAGLLGMGQEASLGNLVWHDTNYNGIQEAGETGIGQATVELYTLNNELVATTQTASDGLYQFVVVAGDYYLRFIPPTGYSLSPQDKGSNDEQDSDPNPESGITNGIITLLPGEVDHSWDVGIYKLLTPQADDDNDSIPNIHENFDVNGDHNPSDAQDTDNDDLPDYLDLDDDQDGILTTDENPDPNGDGDPSDAQDSDGDGIPDYLDQDDGGPDAGDSDNDGLKDDVECPNGIPCPDTDGDGTPDYMDTDDDNDGIPTAEENVDPDGDGIPSDAQDSDGDGIPDYLDYEDDGLDAGDSDGDGLPDDVECAGGPPCLDTDGDGTPDYMDSDDDNDGTPTADEEPSLDNGDPSGVLDELIDTDGDDIPDYADQDDSGPGAGDSDGDGLLDDVECSTGTPCPDSDGDLTPDYMDMDDDGDGLPTLEENPDLNGDGSPSDAQDSDGDGTPDYLDGDDDGDGLPTEEENSDPNGDGNPADAQDSDGDDIPDYLDSDDDGDGIPTQSEDDDNNPTALEGKPDDTDNDGTPNHLDGDDDGDTISTLDENPDPNGDGDPADAQDSDGDGIPDYLDPDDDGDSVPTALEIGPEPENPWDTDQNAVANYLDADDDGDSVGTLYESPDPNGNGNPFDAQNTDGDDLPDYHDNDDDGDTVLTLFENPDPNGDSNPSDAQDTDQDKQPDYLDIDDDQDGLSTSEESPDPNGDGNPSDAHDSDGDSTPNYLDQDVILRISADPVADSPVTKNQEIIYTLTLTNVSERPLNNAVISALVPDGTLRIDDAQTFTQIGDQAPVENILSGLSTDEAELVTWSLTTLAIDEQAMIQFTVLLEEDVSIPYIRQQGDVSENGIRLAAATIEHWVSLQPTVIQLDSFTATSIDTNISVVWQTITEFDIQGFLLWRSPNGNRADAVQITPHLLPSQGKSGATYTFTDDVGLLSNDIAIPHYIYWLQIIAQNGTTSEAGPLHVSAEIQNGFSFFLPVISP